MQCDYEVVHDVVYIGDVGALELKIRLAGRLTKTGLYCSLQVNIRKFNTDPYEYIESMEKYDHGIVDDKNVNGEDTDEYRNILSSFRYKSYINNMTRRSSA